MQLPQIPNENEQLLDGIYFSRLPEDLAWSSEIRIVFVQEAYILIPVVGGGRISYDWSLSLRDQYIAFERSCLRTMVQSENLYSYKSSCL